MPTAPPPALRRVLALAGAVGLASTAVLAATGVWLVRNYRPAPTRRVDEHRFLFVAGGGAVHEAHVWAAIVLQAAVAVVLLVLLARAVRSGRLATAWLAAASGALLTAAVAVGLRTSKGLRWVSLALWAVTVGTDIHGVWPATISRQIRFVLVIGEPEVSTHDYRTRLIAHLVAAPALVAVAALLAVVAVRRSGRADLDRPDAD